MRLFRGKFTQLITLWQNEKRSRDEIRAVQDRKLRRLVRHAYDHVPYYRHRFREAGLAPGDVRTVADLEAVPVSTKADLQKAGSAGWMDARIRDRSRLLKRFTSGSSGAPLTFYVDGSYNQFRRAQFLRPYLTNGRRFTDRSVIFGMYHSLPPKWFHRLGLLVDHAAYSGAPLETHLHILASVNPTVLIGHGSALALIAAHKLEHGLPRLKPRLVFTDSELLVPSMRQRIQEAFGTEVIDVYGSIETENIAYECSCHQGYHMAEDCVVMEFLKDGRPVGPGEEGEIVCTVLDNFTMPFIRYNIRDWGSYTDRPCPCGRRFRLMNVICGRSDDYVCLADGTRRSAWGICQGFRPLSDFIREFQILQHRPDAFAVKIVPAACWHEGTRFQIKALVQREFPGTAVELSLVDRIDREPSGKFRAFKSLVDSGQPAQC